LKGEIIFDPSNLAASSMNVSVDVATISTGNKTKDKHARGKNWFDVENYPQISFQSASFEQTDSGYAVKGTLSLHGVNKQVSIPFTFDATSNGGLFKGQLTVNRKDYGIKGNFFGFSVGKEFTVDINVPVTPVE
ncbi:MAG: YceI family protein, partial [Bacteroidota bacterium]